MQPGINSNTDTGHSGDLPMMVAINEKIKDVMRISNEINPAYPQHGAIFQGKDAARFIDWFSQLAVGTGLQGLSRA